MGTIIEDSTSRRPGAHEPVRFFEARAAGDRGRDSDSRSRQSRGDSPTALGVVGRRGGYPRGLSAAELTMPMRLLAIADVYGAYVRTALPPGAALRRGTRHHPRRRSTAARPRGVHRARAGARRARRHAAQPGERLDADRTEAALNPE